MNGHFHALDLLTHSLTHSLLLLNFTTLLYYCSSRAALLPTLLIRVDTIVHFLLMRMVGPGLSCAVAMPKWLLRAAGLVTGLGWGWAGMSWTGMSCTGLVTGLS